MTASTLTLGTAAKSALSDLGKLQLHCYDIKGAARPFLGHIMDTKIKFEPRWYQTEAVEAFKDFLQHHEPGRNAIIAMPTGTGKSVVIAQIVKYICGWPDNQVLMLTHVGELVKQNADKLRAIWPQGDIGICAAGLGRKDTKQRVIYSTVQTVHSMLKRDKYTFGRRRLVIIDECHLLSEDENSMYRQVLSTLGSLDPKMRVLGLSATPYRTKDGMLTEQENAIFTDVAYDLNQDFARLVQEGYLAPLTSVSTPVAVNLQGVHIQGGDYNSKEVQAAVGNDILLEQACNVIVNEGRYRRSWLVFVSGIQNAKRVQEMLERRCITALAVTSANTSAENAKAIAGFRSGLIRCLVSANQLTTGFDVPQIDLLAILRPTVSASLHVQMLGRGTRPSPGKDNCLVLDFAHNIARLGPINDPFLHERKRKAEEAQKREQTELLPRRCPQCHALLPVRSRECPYCGYRAAQELDVQDLTGLAPISFATHQPTAKGSRVYQVNRFVAQPHLTKSGKHCLRVQVGCAGNGAKFNAFFYLNFDSWRKEAKCDAGRMWLQLHGNDPVPRTMSEAFARSGELQPPLEIEVVRRNFYAGRNFDELVQTYYQGA